MREQINTPINTELTDAELNEVSGGVVLTSDSLFSYSRTGTGGQLGLTQNITVTGYAPGIGGYSGAPVFAGMWGL